MWIDGYVRLRYLRGSPHLLGGWVAVVTGQVVDLVTGLVVVLGAFVVVVVVDTTLTVALNPVSVKKIPSSLKTTLRFLPFGSVPYLMSIVHEGRL